MNAFMQQIGLFDELIETVRAKAEKIKTLGFEEIAENISDAAECLVEACEKVKALGENKFANPTVPFHHSADMKRDNVVLSLYTDVRSIRFYLGVDVMEKARFRLRDKIEFVPDHNKNGFPYALKLFESRKSSGRGYMISTVPEIDDYRRVNIPTKLIPFELFFGRKYVRFNVENLLIEFDLIPDDDEGGENAIDKRSIERQAIHAKA